MSQPTHAGAFAATALVVASMVGVGVFTSLGFQLFDLNSGPQILFLWALGGLIALCGAFCYAEVAAMLPRSGGEYHFLRSIYHPSLGFMAGMLSAFAGFSAPTAITALAFGEYLHKAIGGIPVQHAAAGVILLGTAAHAVSTKTSARVQVAATGLKLLLILIFIGAAWTMEGKGDIRWTPDFKIDSLAVLTPGFAVALLYVTYSYTGWNAAVYGLEEWNDPQKTVRRALLWGTVLVAVLYVGLNASFLHSAPVADLKGQEAVGHIAATSLFGGEAARMVSGLFALGLFASASALLWAGPRVLGAMGRNMRSLSFFAPRKDVPHLALLFQMIVALVLVYAAGLRDLMEATQIGLTLSTSLVVAGSMVMRIRAPELPRPVKIPFYPLPPLIFLTMAGFVIVYSAIQNPKTTLAGAGVAIFFAVVWFPLKLFRR
ncbi:amino acid permease [Luteolibacter sp. GHJ8]|uniref:Amino acid permease n=1 Tax=Luteolibacter rhizosphaerae TaxID=2989719 RepID=A0ABT3G0L8_9BACT|nr:amino acid permease [Luteolibacter rhizosphaerae]MCW1912770.1 amino acid permease [Luteolibacter rhizosphaerae]